jgi:hypothetical protein
MGNESRSYPLPLEITGGSQELRLTVCENPWRYALDSARAEYGPLSPACDEAVHALALVIYSRIGASRKAPPHRDFTFCDLTHCQVYRGRHTANHPGQSSHGEPPWIIESTPGNPLCFHSRCGGRTLGDGVFGLSSTKAAGVRDWISDEGILLCRAGGSAWERDIGSRELLQILLRDAALPDPDSVSLVYDRERPEIRLTVNGSVRRFAPEDFRLRINRVRGWSFIRSNNYRVADKGTGSERRFVFRGAGLGHGAGLCQHGALALAKMGYSRYEILEHYYPDVIFSPLSGPAPPDSPYIAYAIFSLRSGAMEYESHPSIAMRRIPPGSIFKLVVSAYMAARRPDLMRDHRYMCSGKGDDPALPGRCWKPGGHGEAQFAQALSDSCNLYFASLYRHVDRADFARFFEEFRRALSLDAALPEIRNPGDFARLLSGLDFRVKFSVSDLIKTARYFSPSAGGVEPGKDLPRISAERRAAISAALEDTFRSGTVSGSMRPFGSRYNIDPLLKDGPEASGSLWGKTSTVLSGTNRTVSYGLFLGGDEARGIVVVARKTNGHIAAKWGARLLMRAAAEKNR